MSRRSRTKSRWLGYGAIFAALVIAILGIALGRDSSQPLAPAVFGGGGSLIALSMVRWGAFQAFPRLRRRVSLH